MEQLTQVGCQNGARAYLNIRGYHENHKTFFGQFSWNFVFPCFLCKKRRENPVKGSSSYFLLAQ